MVGTTVSHYQILSKLGEGGMGVVYKAHDTTLERDVALKFLPFGLHTHEPERARFLQEARAAALLNHPHICTIHEIGEAQGQPFIVMEYVAGETLRERIQAGQVKYADAITYAIQIAEALLEAHAHGVVHRDVKSDNIMVTGKGQVKVMDFGLAKLKGSLHLTKTSSTVGTLAYMAPEQIECKEVDGRTDIFSFGIVLYEMLTRHLPFRGEHEAAIMYSILNEEPAPVQTYMPDAPSGLVHILDRALAKDPEERYQRVEEMLIDLRRLKKDTTRVTRPTPAASAGIPSGPPTTPMAERKSGRRKLTLIAIGAVVAVTAIVLLVVLLKKPEARLNPNRTSVALSLPFQNISWPSLSGDGKLLAFPAPADDGMWDLYLMNTAGSTPRRLTDERSLTIAGCDISPDLSMVVYGFVPLAPAANVVRVGIIASEGGPTRTLADTAGAPFWTPDGKRIGFMRWGRSGGDPSSSGRLEIWSIRPDGSDRRQELLDTVTTVDPPPFGWSWCWSPDAKSIAWVRYSSRDYGEVMVKELATGRERQLTHDKRRIDEVSWATNGMILFVSSRSGQSNLWMIPADGGGEAAQITQGTAPITSARISADARRILFYQFDNIRQIWTSSVDGTRAYPVTKDEVRTDWCTFSPDGRSIAAVIGPVDILRPGASLCVMDRQGKSRKVLVSSGGLERAYWSPDGRWLAYGDAGNVYLVQPLNPGTPRLLCEGSIICWMGSEDLSIWRGMKSYQYSLSRGLLARLAPDSLRVHARAGTRQILYQDHRQGREGWWVGSLDSLVKEPLEVKRAPALGWPNYYSISEDMRFAIFQKGATPWEGIWRLSLIDGKEERVGTVPAPWMFVRDVAQDGKELLWVKNDDRAKLSLIDNPFE